MNYPNINLRQSTTHIHQINIDYKIKIKCFVVHINKMYKILCKECM